MKYLKTIKMLDYFFLSENSYIFTNNCVNPSNFYVNSEKYTVSWSFLSSSISCDRNLLLTDASINLLEDDFLRLFSCDLLLFVENKLRMKATLN